MREMPVAEVARDVGQVLDAADRGETIVVLREGEPVAVVGPAPIRGMQPVPVRGEGPERWRRWPLPPEPGGILSLVGLFDGWDTFEEDMAQIVADRQNAIDRPPPDFE